MMSWKKHWIRKKILYLPLKQWQDLQRETSDTNIPNNQLNTLLLDIISS